MNGKPSISRIAPTDYKIIFAMRNAFAMRDASMQKPKARLAQLMRDRARAFAGRQDGAAAVEFAMVAMPFMLLTFGILQTALVFFAGQTLQAAAADSGRLIMTGQAQTSSYDAAAFKNQVCARIYGLFNCSSSMTVDVKNYSSSFSDAATGVNSTPTTNGTFDSSKTGYALGGPGCIQVVTLYYQWPVFIPLLGLNTANSGANSRLLQATAVFKNEPYSTSGAC
jgi:Flp pilus assembly protein TadG